MCSATNASVLWASFPGSGSSPDALTFCLPPTSPEQQRRTQCVVALGVSATTLRASVSTKPDQVVHVNAADLPIGSSLVAALKHRLYPQSTPAPNGGPQSASQAKRRVGRTQRRVGATSVRRASEGGAAPAKPSLFDRLLALLRTLALLVLGLLAISSPVVAYRYREEIRALLASDEREPPPTATESRSEETRRQSDAYGVGPSNPVYRSWLRMAFLAGVGDPEARTARQCAREAVRRGLDRAAVESLTDEFEAVRYGGAAVTDARAERARSLRRRLEDGPGGEAT